MGRKTILIIDDSPMVCKLTRLTLEDMGYEVFTFEDFKLAQERIWAGGVDLILLDINMPEVSGLVACKSLKQDDKTKGVPVVFLSTLDDEELSKHAAECGADGYINKNKGFKELASSIKQAVETVY